MSSKLALWICMVMFCFVIPICADANGGTEEPRVPTQEEVASAEILFEMKVRTIVSCILALIIGLSSESFGALVFSLILLHISFAEFWPV